MDSDFIVIGGGIAGASAAYELAGHGRVVLLERESVAGYHTTGRSAALYTAAWEKGLWRTLAMSSRPFLEDPPAGFVEYPLLAPLPVLMIGRDDQRTLVEALVADAGRDVETRIVKAAEAEQLCPLLRTGYVALAALEPDSMAIDVDALHQGFLRGVRKRGGAVKLSHGVDRIRRISGGWNVAAGDVEMTAPVVVNAAGAWCDVVAGLAGVAKIGLVPKRRSAFTFAAPEGISLEALPMVIDVAEQFYFKPDAGQLMGSLAEATPMEPHDVRPEEIDVARGIARIEAATTLRITHVRRTWAGLRSFVEDGVPVVGEDDSAPGFFWLAGQGGAGIMTSPTLAQLVTGLIIDKRVPEKLASIGISEAALGVGRLRS
ncbi:MAG: FAD-binding oxidoreductase [Acidimicrobiia bacterium]|nr:FAD-binding oxidoreductase [Acidimicrobiia bacterium]